MDQIEINLFAMEALLLLPFVYAMKLFTAHSEFMEEFLHDV